MEKEESLTHEEERLLERIRAIKKSPEVQELVRRLASYSENLGIPEFKFRIKQEESALKKFRDKQYTSVDQMGDIVGIMFVTEDEEQLYAVADIMKTVISGTEVSVDDYVQRPKIGYRSLHMNFGSRNIELQIKTMAMYIAQNTVHDSIYKNHKLPRTIRNELSTIAFPIVEKTYEAERLEGIGDVDSATELRTQVSTLIRQNALLFNDYYPMSRIWKEYAKTIFKHRNETNIFKEAFLKGYTPEEKSKRMLEFEDTIDAVYEYFVEEETKSGDTRNITTHAIERLKTLDYATFSSLLVTINEGLDREEKQGDTQPIRPASIEDFEKMNEKVSPHMLMKVFTKLKTLRENRETEERERGKGKKGEKTIGE